MPRMRPTREHVILSLLAIGAFLWLALIVVFWILAFLYASQLPAGG